MPDLKIGRAFKGKKAGKTQQVFKSKTVGFGKMDDEGPNEWPGDMESVKSSQYSLRLG
jgi:hypothetical protein